MLISRLFSLLFYRPQKRFMHFHLTISTEMVFTFLFPQVFIIPLYISALLFIYYSLTQIKEEVQHESEKRK